METDRKELAALVARIGATGAGLLRAIDSADSVESLRGSAAVLNARMALGRWVDFVKRSGFDEVSAEFTPDKHADVT